MLPRLLAAAAVPSIALLLAALLLGPRSCDPGVQGTYLGLGVGYLVILLALPFLLGRAWSASMRLGAAALGLVAGVGVWIGGFVLGDFRLICRLF